MKTLRVLVVDDEPLAREGVTARLAGRADFVVVGECGDVESAAHAVDELAPDVIFLDVRMPGADGFGLLERIAPERRPYIVFLTAYDRFALRAFDAEAVDYLLKPIDDERFARALDRVRAARRSAELEAKENGGAYPARFPVRVGRRVLIAHASDIDWVEAIGDYCGLHTASKVHLVREPLHTLEGRLDPKQFMRVHRSTIVRIDRVAELRAATNRDAVARLHDGTILKVSRTYSEALRKALSE